MILKNPTLQRGKSLLLQVPEIRRGLERRHSVPASVQGSVRGERRGAFSAEEEEEAKDEKDDFNASIHQVINDLQVIISGMKSSDLDAKKITPGSKSSWWSTVTRKHSERRVCCSEVHISHPFRPNSLADHVPEPPLLQYVLSDLFPRAEENATGNSTLLPMRVVAQSDLHRFFGEGEQRKASLNSDMDGLVTATTRWIWHKFLEAVGMDLLDFSSDVEKAWLPILSFIIAQEVQAVAREEGLNDLGLQYQRFANWGAPPTPEVKKGIGIGTFSMTDLQCFVKVTMRSNILLTFILLHQSTRPPRTSSDYDARRSFSLKGVLDADADCQLYHGRLSGSDGVSLPRGRDSSWLKSPTKDKASSLYDVIQQQVSTKSGGEVVEFLLSILTPTSPVVKYEMSKYGRRRSVGNDMVTITAVTTSFSRRFYHLVMRLALESIAADVNAVIQNPHITNCWLALLEKDKLIRLYDNLQTPAQSIFSSNLPNQIPWKGSLLVTLATWVKDILSYLTTEAEQLVAAGIIDAAVLRLRELGTEVVGSHFVSMGYGSIEVMSVAMRPPERSNCVKTWGERLNKILSDDQKKEYSKLMTLMRDVAAGVSHRITGRASFASRQMWRRFTDFAPVCVFCEINSDDDIEKGEYLLSKSRATFYE